MVSQTSRYALRTLGYLVARPDQRVPGGEIAAATGIPSNYLSKVLAQLRKHGLLESEKGWGGGFRVREESLDLPIRNVVRIFDGEGADPDRRGCVFGLPECDANHPCPLHAYWEQVGKTMTEMIDRTVIRDLGQSGP